MFELGVYSKRQFDLYDWIKSDDEIQEKMASLALDAVHHVPIAFMYRVRFFIFNPGIARGADPCGVRGYYGWDYDPDRDWADYYNTSRSDHPLMKSDEL